MIEMVEILSLKLIRMKKFTTEIGLYVGYSKDIIPSSGGTHRLSKPVNTYTQLAAEFIKLFEKTTNPNADIRRIGINFGRLTEEGFEQLNLFEDLIKTEKERSLENTINIVKGKMGKSAIFRGMDLQENATTLIRNKLIGGHNSN